MDPSHAYLEAMISENRTAIADLRVNAAETAAALKYFAEASDELKDTVKELHATVTTLSDALSKSKGALWVIGGLTAAAGGLVVSIINKALS